MCEGWLANGIAAGGQLTTTSDVENFPGFPEGILGGEITERFRQQSERFGTNILTETVTKVGAWKAVSIRSAHGSFSVDGPPRVVAAAVARVYTSGA
jgi:thioredoxin reductase